MGIPLRRPNALAPNALTTSANSGTHHPLNGRSRFVAAVKPNDIITDEWYGHTIQIAYPFTIWYCTGHVILADEHCHTRDLALKPSI